MDVFERAVALAGCPVFESVPAPALLAIAERATAIAVAAGAPLPVKTDAGDGVVVTADGELVGALGAFVDEAPPEAAVAAQATVVIRMWRDDFLDLIADHPAAARALSRQLAARIRGTR
jgi:CRP-like cAMP-binding protein